MPQKKKLLNENLTRTQNCICRFVMILCHYSDSIANCRSESFASERFFTLFCMLKKDSGQLYAFASMSIKTHRLYTTLYHNPQIPNL